MVLTKKCTSFFKHSQQSANIYANNLVGKVKKLNFYFDGIIIFTTNVSSNNFHFNILLFLELQASLNAKYSPLRMFKIRYQQLSDTVWRKNYLFSFSTFQYVIFGKYFFMSSIQIQFSFNFKNKIGFIFTHQHTIL